MSRDLVGLEALDADGDLELLLPGLQGVGERREGAALQAAVCAHRMGGRGLWGRGGGDRLWGIGDLLALVSKTTNLDWKYYSRLNHAKEVSRNFRPIVSYQKG